MGRPKSPHGYRNSRYNRLTHGVEIDGVLPSRGVEHCFYADRCPVAEDPRIQHVCQPGEPCPYEQWIHDRYVESARTTFSFCRKWLADDDFDRTVHQLSIVELRRGRLSALVARQGFFRPKTHPTSGIQYGIEENLGVGRYATALDRRFNALMSEVLNDPQSDVPVAK